MRVTDAILASRVIRSINDSKSRLSRLQNILSTGKKINKPSDDPLRISAAFNFKKELQEVNQYMRNIETATTWVDLTNSTLSQVSEILNSARVIALRESNATATSQSRAASAQEVENLRIQLLNLANTSFQSKYLFSGTKTLTKPFQENGTYRGDSGEIRIQIEDNQTITVNVPGDKVFQANEDVFAVLSDLREGLEDNDPQVIASQIDRLDQLLSQIHRWEGEFGGRGRRVQIFKSRLEDRRVGLTRLLSITEDADMVKIATKLQHAGVAYQAALSAGKKIMQYILIDFWE